VRWPSRFRWLHDSGVKSEDDVNKSCAGIWLLLFAIVLKIESCEQDQIVRTVFFRKYGRHYHYACGDLSIRLEQAKRAIGIAQHGFLGIP
jgi:hypothetical protein